MLTTSLNSIILQIVHHGMWRPLIYWVNWVSFSHTLFNEIAADLHKLVVNCFAFWTGLPVCTCHNNSMHKLAPPGSGCFVDGCGERSVFFILDILMVKVAYYFNFTLKQVIFRIMSKRMLEMWNQNSVFERWYIITMYILWRLLLKQCFLAIPSQYDPRCEKINITITPNYNFV